MDSRVPDHIKTLQQLFSLQNSALFPGQKECTIQGTGSHLERGKDIVWDDKLVWPNCFKDNKWKVFNLMHFKSVQMKHWAVLVHWTRWYCQINYQWQSFRDRFSISSSHSSSHTHRYTQTYTRMHAHKHMHAHRRVRVCVRVCVCVCVRVCACVCVCVFVFPTPQFPLCYSSHRPCGSNSSVSQNRPLPQRHN